MGQKPLATSKKMTVKPNTSVFKMDIKMKLDRNLANIDS